MAEIVNNWLNIVQQWGRYCLPLPCHCLLCLESSQRDIALCRACEQKLPFLTKACLLCALPLEQEDRLCGQCLGQKPPYKRLRALFDYTWPLDAFIAKFKYNGDLHFAKMLGALMAKYLCYEAPIDCIVPMPLHPLRQQIRGFNQSIELGRIIAYERQLPLDRWSCLKTVGSSQQSLLSAKGRSSNVSEKSFVIHPRLQAKHVLIIEDVVTTGATVNAFTRALKNAGVQSVQIWSCCRTGIAK